MYSGCPLQCDVIANCHYVPASLSCLSFPSHLWTHEHRKDTDIEDHSKCIAGESTPSDNHFTTNITCSLQVPHAFVNCIECYSSKLLYKTILSQLSGTMYYDVILHQ